MSIFSDAIDFLASIMQHFLSFCYQLTQMAGFPSYGIAIIVMTILIRVLLLPLAIKQIRSMKSMQEMQPRLQEIQKKYKGDPQRIQMEMTKMYQEMGVNPLSGCLPMLIQMPFLISIFYALRSYQYIPNISASYGCRAWARPIRTMFYRFCPRCRRSSCKSKR